MSPAAGTAAVRTRRGTLLAYIGVLALAAAGLSALADAAGLTPPVSASPWTLPVFAGLLVAAEYLFVRFRFRGEVNALNLLEAVLAPMLLGFEVVVVVATMVIAQLAAGILRRNQLDKLVFNIAQWSLAAAVGGTLLHALPLDRGISWGAVGGIVLALAFVGIVNQTAFTFVISIVDGRSPVSVLRGLMPVIPGWGVGWIVNVLTGLLLVVSFAAADAAVLLFPVPLVVLHLAYRGFAGARSDRVRLAGLPRAAQALAAPLDPLEGLAPYLREVAACFEASAAELAFAADGKRVIHRVERVPHDRYVTEVEPADHPSLEAALMGSGQATRISATSGGAPAELLAARGFRDCLAAPLLQDGAVIGVLLILDQAGLEGFEQGELAVIESLARETAATLGKGRLVSTLIAERRQLQEIVGTASDGIFTIDRDGIIRSWNPAMQRITGRAADELLGRGDGLARIRFRDPAGGDAGLASWTAAPPPALLEVSPPSGDPVRLLACTYSVARAGSGEPSSLIVIARDMTPDLEMASLRAEYDRLSRAEEAHRAMVDRLQEAIMPPAPRASGVELGVRYLPSDPSAPTGGDLYDWQVLPDGDVYLSVIDVLGHGVSATKNALGVVHALRTLVLQDRPLEDVIAAADGLLRAHDPELVATAMIARFTPATGELRLAAGGHPPALIASPSGGVRPIPAAGGAIGWPGAGSTGLAMVTLEPGDALVLYTDGLVESGKDIIEGEEKLQRYLRELIGTDAGTMAEEVLARALADGERRDDSLVLVLRRAPAVERISWRITPSPAAASSLRQEATAWLESRGVEEADLIDLELVCAELLSNAVKAARARVDLRVQIEDGRVAIEVEDDGAGDPDLARRGWSQPPDFSDAGRGLFLVRSITEDVSALSTGDGSVVRAVKRVGAEVSSDAGAGMAQRDQARGYIEPR